MGCFELPAARKVQRRVTPGISLRGRPTDGGVRAFCAALSAAKSGSWLEGGVAHCGRLVIGPVTLKEPCPEGSERLVNLHEPVLHLGRHASQLDRLEDNKGLLMTSSLEDLRPKRHRLGVAAC